MHYITRQILGTEKHQNLTANTPTKYGHPHMTINMIAIFYTWPFLFYDLFIPGSIDPFYIENIKALTTLARRKG